MKVAATRISGELVVIRLPATRLPGEPDSIVESTFCLTRGDGLSFEQRTFDQWLRLANQGGGTATVEID